MHRHGKANAIIGVVVGAAILRAALTSACGGNKEQKQACAPSTASTATPTASDYNAPGTIGKEVRDGKLAFVVTAIQACMGEPIKVSMKVTNTWTGPETFLPSVQKLLRNPFHASGQILEGGWACTECDGNGEELYINAGDSVATVMSFDIKGEEPAIKAVELHDSIWSFGVEVYP